LGHGSIVFRNLLSNYTALLHIRNLPVFCLFNRLDHSPYISDVLFKESGLELYFFKYLFVNPKGYSQRKTDAQIEKGIIQIAFGML